MASWTFDRVRLSGVHLDGALSKEYPDLSMDSPDSDNYFRPSINEDTSNHYITVDNLFSGTPTASDRPANFYVSVPKASIGAKTILCRQDVHRWAVWSCGCWYKRCDRCNLHFGSEVTRDTLRVTCTNATGPVLAVTSRDKMTHIRSQRSRTQPPCCRQQEVFSVSHTLQVRLLQNEYTDITCLAFETNELKNGKNSSCVRVGCKRTGLHHRLQYRKQRLYCRGDLTLGDTLCNQRICSSWNTNKNLKVVATV